MKKLMGIILTAIGAVTAVTSAIIKIKGFTLKSSISSPDGPTVIYSAGEIGNGFFIFGIIVGIILLSSGIFITLKKNKS